MAAGLPFAGSGKVFIVGDSATANLSMLKDLFIGDADGKLRFYSTVDAAVSACTASAGDIVLVMPGHTESVTSATAVAFDVAGVTVIGLGNGNDRPTFNFTTLTTSLIAISGANFKVVNCIFDLTGVDAVAVGLDINASDCTIEKCRIVMGDSDGQAVVGILTDTNIDRLSVLNCEFQGDTIAGPAAAIRLIGGVEHKIVGNFIHGSFSSGPIALITTAPLRILIENNVLLNTVASGDAAIVGIAGATGAVRFNAYQHLTDSLGDWLKTPGSLSSYENYGVNALGETAILDITGGLSTT